MTILRYIMLCLFLFCNLNKQGLCCDENKLTKNKRIKPQFILKESCYQCKLIFQKEIDGDYHFVEGVLLPMLTKTQSHFFSQENMLVSFQLDSKRRYQVFIYIIDSTKRKQTQSLISVMMEGIMTCFYNNYKLTLECYYKKL